MHYYVLTLFPEMITNACGESILGRASQKGLISVEAINIRDYSTNKHNRVDDYPYGGGAGMVMQPMPVYDAWKDLTERIGKKPRVLFMTPQGKPFSQKLAEEYAKEYAAKEKSVSVKNLMHNMKLNLDEALNALGIQGDERELIIAQLQEQQ